MPPGNGPIITKSNFLSAESRHLKTSGKIISSLWNCCCKCLNMVDISPIKVVSQTCIDPLSNFLRNPTDSTFWQRSPLTTRAVQTRMHPATRPRSNEEGVAQSVGNSWVSGNVASKADLLFLLASAEESSHCLEVCLPKGHFWCCVFQICRDLGDWIAASINHL